MMYPSVTKTGCVTRKTSLMINFPVVRQVYTYIHVQIRIRAYMGQTTIRIFAEIENQKKEKRDPLVSVGITN
jgi:hypothetical protein